MVCPAIFFLWALATVMALSLPLQVSLPTQQLVSLQHGHLKCMQTHAGFSILVLGLPDPTHFWQLMLCCFLLCLGEEQIRHTMLHLVCSMPYL